MFYEWHVNQDQTQSVVAQLSLRTRKIYEHLRQPCQSTELFVVPVAEVLAIASACNAAYSTIKTCIQNGRELTTVMDKIGVVIDGEEQLKQQVEKHKNSPLNKMLGKSASDLEAFQCLEQMRENRRNLESMMKLYGRPGSWDRFVSFEAEMRKKRAEAKRAAAKAHEERMELYGYIAAGVIFVAFLGGLLYYVASVRGLI